MEYNTSNLTISDLSTIMLGLLAVMTFVLLAASLYGIDVQSILESAALGWKLK